MDEPKVSVIIPVFNSSKYLRDCLDSVLSQSLTKIEIICGDGGSKDGSLEILREYECKDSRIRVIHGEGHGYGESLNECVDAATGEYIGIVESDDMIKPMAYETLCDVAKKYDLDWVRSDIYFYYSSLPANEQLKRESIIYDGGFYNEVLDPQYDFRPYKSGLRTWSGIYKRTFLNQYGIKHNETPGGAYQDVGFYLKTLYYAHRVMFIDKPFYMWRQDNPDSTIHFNSSKLVQKSLTEWKLNQEYLDRHKELGHMAIGSYHYRKFYSYLWTLNLAEGKDKEVVKATAAKEYARAIKKGEIERGFFAEDEWDRFLHFLTSIGVKSQVSPNGDFIKEKRLKKLKRALKRYTKRLLRPVASLCRKISLKLMRDVIAVENEHHQILLNILRSIEQAQITEKDHIEIWSCQCKQKLDACETLLSKMSENYSKSSVLLTTVCCDIKGSIVDISDSIKEIERLENEREVAISMLNDKCEALKDYAGENAKIETEHQKVLHSTKRMIEDVQKRAEETGQKVDAQDWLLRETKCEIDSIQKYAEATGNNIADQGETIWKVKCRLEDIQKHAEETGQKVIDQGEILWAAKCRLEDIHKRTEETGQKVVDQGEILWAAKCRLEDIHKRTEETGQKVLDQGEMLWKVHDRVEDVCTIGDSYIVHPQYGASKIRHEATASLTSLLTEGNEAEKRDVCKNFLCFIEIEPFSHCNRQCWFCPNKFIDRHTDNHYMDETLFLKILGELQEIDYSGKIAFSRYNEPLSDRIILNRIEQTRKRCPNAFLTANTNGDYLTRAFLEELIEAGLNELIVQCYFEEDEAFSFESYHRRLEKFGIRLGLSSYHIEERKDNDRFSAEFEIDGIKLTYFSLCMREFANNRGGSLDNTKEYIRNENCISPFRRLYVDYTGSYMMCCNVRSDNENHRPFIVGDAHEDTVFDVFCGKKLIDVRKAVGSGKNLPFPCSTCQYVTLDDDFNIF